MPITPIDISIGEVKDSITKLEDLAIKLGSVTEYDTLSTVFGIAVLSSVIGDQVLTIVLGVIFGVALGLSR